MKKLWKGLSLWIRILIIIFLSIILLIFIIYFTISPITKSYIIKHDKELIGRKISIEDLRINIFKARLDIKNFNLYEKDDKTVFFGLDSLNFEIKLFPMLKNKIIVDRVFLGSANLNITQDKEVFNFDDIIEFFADTTATVSDTNSKPWDITINNIDIINSNIVYKDLEIDAKWALNDFSLNIPTLHFSDTVSNLGIAFTFGNGGSLALKAKYNYETSKYNLNVDLKDFSISGILPYLQQDMNISKIEGDLSAKLSIEGDLENVMNFDLNGNISNKNFLMVDNGGNKLLGIDYISTDIENINLIKNKYILSNLIVKHFSTYFDMNKDSTNNFTYLFKPTPPEELAQDTTSQTSPKMDFIIKELRVSESEFVFNDKTLRNTFSYPITNIEITSNNLKLEGENNMVISSNIGSTGRVEFKYKGIIDNMNNHDISLVIRNAQLREFTPYSLDYFALPIEKGNMTIIAHNIIKNANLVGANSLEVYSSKFGKKDKTIDAEYKNIPLKTALYIIEDRNKKISFDLPVSGNVNSPEFSYKKLIFQTLGNLMIKLVASPFDALGSALGINPGDLEFINIDINSNEFSTDEFEKINNITKLIKEKPELEIQMQLEVNYEQNIKTLSLINLKKSFYYHYNPEKIGKTLSILEADSIINIKNNNPNLEAFTNATLLEKGLSLEGNITDKAQRLYKDITEKEIIINIERTNQRLKTYLDKEAPENKVNIQTQTLQEMKSHTNKTRYKTSIKAE